MFLGDSHKVVDIDVYKSSPKNFNKPTCEHHQEVLVRACKKCDKLICFECEIDGEDCTGNVVVLYQLFSKVNYSRSPFNEHLLVNHRS